MRDNLILWATLTAGRRLEDGYFTYILRLCLPGAVLYRSGVSSLDEVHSATFITQQMIIRDKITEADYVISPLTDLIGGATAMLLPPRA